MRIGVGMRTTRPTPFPMGRNFKSHRDKVQMIMNDWHYKQSPSFKSHRDKVQIAMDKLFFGVFSIFEHLYYI